MVSRYSSRATVNAARAAVDSTVCISTSSGSEGPGVVAGAVEVDHDRRLVADDPGVVAARQRREVSRAGHELGAVVHADAKPPAHVVLEVRGLAACGLRDGLDVVRPAPAGLEDEAANRRASQGQQLGMPVLELTDLLGLDEALVLRSMRVGHVVLLGRAGCAILTYW